MLMRNDSVQSDQLDVVGERALAGVLLLGRSQDGPSGESTGS